MILILRCFVGWTPGTFHGHGQGQGESQVTNRLLPPLPAQGDYKGHAV